MLKHIYKILGLIVVFVLALWFFSKNIEEIKVHIIDDTVESEAGTFPVVNLINQNMSMNRLFGYSGNTPANVVRESVTPLGADKSMKVSINKCKTTVNKLNYEVRAVDTNELLDSGSVSAFDQKDVKPTASLAFDIDFKVSTEYALKLTLVTDVSKKINYYTRLKYYQDESYLKDKVDFAMNFHKMTFAKDEEVNNYIEPDSTVDNTTLANANINSSFENVVWGSLVPKEITQVIPTVKEYNIETASIQIVYYATAETDTGLETFYVKEFYRVKHTDDRMYLLWFERSIEANFEVNLASTNCNQLKAGITSGSDIQVVSNDAATKVAFVRNGDVYQYDLESNTINRLYSQYLDNDENEHELYRQQNTHIISVDEEGNMCFAVYGYMEHGAYEGKVAIVLYKYHVSDNAIEEMLYIPIQTTYQMLKENFENYCYVNTHDVFYFSIDDNVYSYNIVSEKFECIAEKVDEKNFTIVESADSYVWENAADTGIAKELVILNLETGNKVTIPAESDSYIRLIGVIGSNVVYGTGKINDINNTADGTAVYAMSKIKITDISGNEIKTYNKKNYYVVNAYIDNNVVYLDRCKKGKDGKFSKAPQDNIINRMQSVSSGLGLVSRVTDKTMTEWYFSLPQSFVMKEIPKFKVTNNYVVTKEHSLYLDESESSVKYYVYAKGGIEGKYISVAEAIVKADSEQGVVIDNNNQTIWERGGRFNTGVVTGLKNTAASGKVSSIDACAYMVINALHLNADINDFAGKNMSMTDILAKYIDSSVNLTGCNLDEVLYFVSNKKSVIAMKDGSNAVLITGYTQNSVTIYDPVTGSVETVFQTNADPMFSAAGNVFVSYLKGE